MYIEFKKDDEIMTANAKYITIAEMELLAKMGWIVINYVNMEKEA